MKKNNLYFLFFIVVVFTIASCKKTPPGPPVKTPGQMLTISDLRSIAGCTNHCQQVFTSDVYVSGVVLADDISGNFYKETYIRDATGALHLTFKAAANFYIGDSVRVNLNGLSIGYNPSSSMLEVDSVDTDKAFVNLGKGLYPQPKLLDMNQINTPGYYANLMNDLVVINGIGFAPTDTDKIYVGINQTTQNRTLLSCSGDQITLRTNAYAKFAGQKTPTGHGNIIGIATNYGSTKQLVIRNTTEWSMTYTNCITPGLYLKKNFTDNSITSGGWTMQNVTGSISWSISTLGSWVDRPYASISNFVSGNQLCETWLISPLINLSAATNPVLTFANAYNYTGPALAVMVSTNYTSGAPSAATWVPLTYNASAGGFAFTNSGNISLNSYKTTGVSIAFKYTGSTTSGSTWEVDDIAVIEN